MPIPKSLFAIMCRSFSSLPKHPNFTKIPLKHRTQAIKQAQQALTEYLHSTRLVPFTYADNISKNALVSLAYVVSDITFSAPSFSTSLRKFLRYHPINEFEFFYESIGIDYDEVPGFLPKSKFFFSEDESALNAACALSDFGFPWNKLGLLYKKETSIFSKSSDELTSRLLGFKEYGFGNIPVISICLAFPYVLSGEMGVEIDALFVDLKRVLVDSDMGSCVEGNVEAWYDICRKIQVFYDLDCERGKLRELMGKNKSIFVNFSLEVLTRKAAYFCRLGVRKKYVALLLLQKPDILNFDLETPVISVWGFLKHFGLSFEELRSVSRRYPHVMGRNTMVNLPHVMRAMDLNGWFFNNIKDGNHQLLASYALSYPDEDLDDEFRYHLEKIKVSKYARHTLSKLDFMHGIGFGENVVTMKVLAHLHSTSNQLQERFDCLLHGGIAFSNLCKMLCLMPKILNQSPEILEEKLNYLCHEIGCSLQSLDIFPAYFNFNLENRIKPRCRFHMWLAEKGLYADKYSLASIIATSEKNFVARLYVIHPAAPKHWFESFANRKKQQRGRTAI